MARTKKTEEMELNLTPTDEITNPEMMVESETDASIIDAEECVTDVALEADAAESGETAPILLSDTDKEFLAALDEDTPSPVSEEDAMDELTQLSGEEAVDGSSQPTKTENVPEETLQAAESEATELTPSAPKKRASSKKKTPPSVDESATPATPAKKTTRAKKVAPSVLTIDSKSEAETPEDREDIIWHEIHNAYRTRKILTGTLGGIEQTENGKPIAIAYYKDFRIVIPMSEMMINLSTASDKNYGEMMLRQSKILGTMLGAEIDFLVKGIDSKTKSVVASRKDAMMKKRQLFYMGTDASGMYRIYEDRIVQARVIAVADKVIRVEAFGVECSIMARDLSWDWLGDAHERFSVGDQILIRILGVKRDSLDSISIKADVKSVSGNTGKENLKKCRVQGKYAGKVTDIHKGTVFVRLSIGVNAIAHSCYDNRMPGKKDDVSFAVTHLDEERGVAVGIITRIIKQNL